MSTTPNTDTTDTVAHQPAPFVIPAPRLIRAAPPRPKQPTIEDQAKALKEQIAALTSSSIRPGKRLHDAVQSGTSSSEDSSEEDTERHPKRQRINELGNHDFLNTKKKFTKVEQKVIRDNLHGMYSSQLTHLPEGKVSTQDKIAIFASDPMAREVRDGLWVVCDACAEFRLEKNPDWKGIKLDGQYNFTNWRKHRLVCPEGIRWFVRRTMQLESDSQSE